MDQAELSRLLLVACGMQELLATMAADDSLPRFYRAAAVDVLTAWSGTAPQVEVGSENPSPIILHEPSLTVVGPPAERAETTCHLTRDGQPLSVHMQRNVDRVQNAIEQGSVTVPAISLITGLAPRQAIYALQSGPFHLAGRGEWALNRQAKSPTGS